MSRVSYSAETTALFTPAKDSFPVRPDDEMREPLTTRWAVQLGTGWQARQKKRRARNNALHLCADSRIFQTRFDLVR
jgi:hypothetical protein